MTSYWCERALLPTGFADRVRVEADERGIIVEITENADTRGAARLPGVVFPGFANTHSHAFHRALRGRTHDGGGTFWTWREAMYRVAARLDPDGYFALARLVFAEMALAGYTCVGEFHYLHHGPGGAPYADPNAMGHALVAAAADAGIRITLLDTCYLAGGLGLDGYAPLSGPQTRFGDGDMAGWLDRVGRFAPRGAHARAGAAIHSVRAVPADALPAFAPLVADRPVHVHLSEQPRENAACLAAHGRTPTELLARAGLLAPGLTAVHATHLTDADVRLLGDAGVTACLCPTTEADLADGIGRARDLADAGCPIALGSDQHAVVDPFAETRALEHGERLRSGRRGRFGPAELHAAATVSGHRALGWPDAGRIAVGGRCDLVAVHTDTVRTAGAAPGQLVFAATASDVARVVADGRVIGHEGRHASLGEVGPALAELIGDLLA